MDNDTLELEPNVESLPKWDDSSYRTLVRTTMREHVDTDGDLTIDCRMVDFLFKRDIRRIENHHLTSSALSAAVYDEFVLELERIKKDKLAKAASTLASAKKGSSQKPFTVASNIKIVKKKFPDGGMQKSVAEGVKEARNSPEVIGGLKVIKEMKARLIRLTDKTEDGRIIGKMTIEEHLHWSAPHVALHAFFSKFPTSDHNLLVEDAVSASTYAEIQIQASSKGD